MIIAFSLGAVLPALRRELLDEAEGEAGVWQVADRVYHCGETQIFLGLL